jgi:hypothetical protein
LTAEAADCKVVIKSIPPIAIGALVVYLQVACAASPIPFELKWTLTQGPADATYVAIRSRDQWEEMWRKIRSDYAGWNDALTPNPGKIPATDFARFTLIVAATGRKSSGGYSISINDIDETPNNVLVHVVETSPSQTCAGITMSTSPFVGVQIPATNKPVNFDIKKVSGSC